VDVTREVVAYGLIFLAIIITIPWVTIALVRRKRRKLRRNGIKTYGH